MLFAMPPFWCTCPFFRIVRSVAGIRLFVPWLVDWFLGVALLVGIFPGTAILSSPYAVSGVEYYR